MVRHDMQSSPETAFAKAQAYFADFGEGLPLKWRAYVEILKWLEEQELHREVYLSVGLSGIWLSDRLFGAFRDDHILNILVQGDFIHFEYHRIHGSTDTMKKTVTRVEATECLRQFLNHKFGIHRVRASLPNHSPEPAPGAVH